MAAYKVIDVNEGFRMLSNFNQTCEKLFLDVRNREELKEQGALPGFINCPKDKLSSRHFEHNQTVVISCRSGKRAKMAAENAIQQFSVSPDKIIVMDGGIEAWKKAGYTSVEAVSPFVHLFYHEDTSTCCFLVVGENDTNKI